MCSVAVRRAVCDKSMVLNRGGWGKPDSNCGARMLDCPQIRALRHRSAVGPRRQVNFYVCDFVMYAVQRELFYAGQQQLLCCRKRRAFLVDVRGAAGAVLRGAEAAVLQQTACVFRCCLHTFRSQVQDSRHRQTHLPLLLETAACSVLSSLLSMVVLSRGDLDNNAGSTPPDFHIARFWERGGAYYMGISIGRIDDAFYHPPWRCPKMTGFNTAGGGNIRITTLNPIYTQTSIWTKKEGEGGGEGGGYASRIVIQITPWFFPRGAPWLNVDHQMGCTSYETLWVAPAGI